MKVKELKEALKEIDDNLEVLIASDEEGNSFNLLFEVSPNSRGQIESGQWETFHPDDWDDFPELQPVVVLWP